MKLKEYVFVKVHNSEQVGKISIEDLQIIYENYYKQDCSYTVFLYEVLNFKRAIPIKFFYNPKGIHTLNEKIMSIYRKFGMERIKKIYTVNYITDETVQLLDMKTYKKRLLDRVVSANGERYGDENVKIHIKGSHMTLTQNGRNTSCFLVK